MDVINEQDAKRLELLSARVLELAASIQLEIDTMTLPDWAHEDWSLFAWALKDAQQLRLCCWCDEQVATERRGMDVLCETCAAKREVA